MARADVKSPPAPLPAPAEPEVVEADVVRGDRGEGDLAEVVAALTESGVLTKRDALTWLVSEGATDTGSVTIALWSLEDEALERARAFFDEQGPDEAATFDAEDIPA